MLQESLSLQLVLAYLIPLPAALLHCKILEQMPQLGISQVCATAAVIIRSCHCAGLFSMRLTLLSLKVTAVVFSFHNFKC